MVDIKPTEWVDLHDGIKRGEEHGAVVFRFLQFTSQSLDEVEAYVKKHKSEALFDFTDEDLWEPCDPVELPFKIGQDYGPGHEDTCPATQIRCRKCKGTEFHVGTGSYYTAIRCVKCQWEECIHEG